ncbi:hypothetical protein KAU51_04115 [Candidatus Parcubacteria bacterium]|nr:hypothetical protein [Candidatus Parcubacteria bacterium]
MINNTNSNTKPFTLDDLKKCAETIQKNQEKELPKGLGWFTKLMNRFGWHRKYEIIVIDKEKFKFNIFDKPTL